MWFRKKKKVKCKTIRERISEGECLKNALSRIEELEKIRELMCPWKSSYIMSHHNDDLYEAINDKIDKINNQC